MHGIALDKRWLSIEKRRFEGINYFCYWSPAGQSETFLRGGGVVYPRGSLNSSLGPPGDLSKTSATLYRKGAHYRHATRLNSIVRNWGRARYLLTATSTAVYRIMPPSSGGGGKPAKCTCQCGQPTCPQPSQLLAGCAIDNITDLAVSSSRWTPKAGEGLLIGQFQLADGRTALLLHNHNIADTIWPTIDFASPHQWSAAGGRGVLEVCMEPSIYSIIV